MSYAYNTRTNSISKWDTIQEDVADAYAYLDEEVEQDEDELEDELTDEHERYGIANNIVMQLQNVHKSGQGEYDKRKSELKKDNLPRFAFGEKDNIRGANGMMYKYDPKQKVYVDFFFLMIRRPPRSTLL